MKSIPEIANELIEDIIPLNEINSSTIVVVGSKSAGKSSLIHSILDKTEQPRETLMLEYSFGRKSNQKQGIDKNISHVWEYGGNLDIFKNVMNSIPLKGNLIYCIMLDLSKIRALWNTLEICLGATKEELMNLETSEIIIVGGKYDVFKNFDSDVKKIICTTLRCVALIHNCNLMFHSSKESSLVRRSKDIFQSLMFKNDFPVKEKASSITKPIFIRRGTDSWESIGVAAASFAELKAKHLSLIPLEVETATSQLKSSVPPSTHAEPTLDSKLNSKYEELKTITSYDISLADYFYKK